MPVTSPTTPMTPMPSVAVPPPSDPPHAARRTAPVRPHVTAVLVLRDGAPWLPRTLDALASQTRQPDRLVVLDLASDDGSVGLVEGHEALRLAVPDLVVRRLADGAALSFTAAVDRAVAQLPEPTGIFVGADEPVRRAGTAEPVDPDAQWLWLCPDDAAAAPDALARLVGAVRRSPSVGVAGPKVVEWDNPRRLVEIGHQLTRAGRRVGEPAFGEVDQGQYDTRTDVLAVGSCGMLVRRALFARIGGFAAAPSPGGASLDLGWRAQLAGERVVVVPSAVVRAAGVPYAAERTASTNAHDAPALALRRAQRSAARRVALTRCSPWLAPLLAAWIAVGSLVSALALLLLKRPAHAWVELADLGALVHPWSSLRARWAFRGRRVLRRRDLGTLFIGSAEALRHTGDRVQEALTPSFAAGATATAGTALESGPVSEEAEDLTTLPASLGRRVLTNPGVLVTAVAVAVGVLGFRGSLLDGLLDAQGAGVVGGEFTRVATDSGGLFHAFRDAWHGAGLGAPGEGSPLLGVLASLSWLAERLPYVASGRSPASVMLTWVLLLGMPLATATAYLAGRVVTPARWTRALVALAWGCSGIAVAAVSGGRVGVVLAHILAPLVLAGVARCATSGATFTAAAATALAAGVLGACVPVSLVPVALAALLLVVVGPGLRVRARGLLLLVLPLGLQGHWLLALRDPSTLLSGPGLLDAAPAPEVSWWLAALGRPDGGDTLPVLLTAPFVVLAVAALTRRARSRGAAVAVSALALLALLGLAAVLAFRRVVVGSTEAADGTFVPATPWPGIGAQALWLAILALALLGSVGLGRALREHAGRPARLLAGIGLAVLGCGVLLAGALLGWTRLDTALAVGHDAVPAVAVDQANGPGAARTLVVRPGTEVVEYQLVGAEPGDVLRDRDPGTRPHDPGIGTVVSTLAAGRTELPTTGDPAGTAATTTGDPAGTAATTIGDRLADLGVGFVSVRDGAGEDLTRTLDAAGGLTRLGSTDGQTLWRVLARASATRPSEVVAPGRVRIVAANGAPIEGVPVDGPHATLDAALPAGPADRLLVVAESPDWAAVAQVRVDGTLATARSVGGLPAYPLPARAVTVAVELPPTAPRWFLGQLLLVGLAIFLAIPFGNRRSRRLR